jgi:uncharacterized membrane protein
VTTGPVQLLVVGFNQPDFRDDIIDALQQLQASRTVRVLDSLAVFKGTAGDIEVQHLSRLPVDAVRGSGRLVAALIGLGIDGEEGLVLADEAGGEPTTQSLDLFLEEDGGWDVLEEIPDDTASALVLIEHRWAVPLRDAIVRAGGFRISDGFISPLDLIDIGLASPDEADELLAIESGDPTG